VSTYLILGAAGSIGQEVVRQLVAAGQNVIGVVRDHHRAIVSRQVAAYGARVDVIDDVADRSALKSYSEYLAGICRLDGVVYAVGHCPPCGFGAAIRRPLSELALGDYLREINMHQVGVLNTFQCMLENLRLGGSFVFLSSAITRLKGQFPPAMQAHYHASVISAEDWLIDGMRHDPSVIKEKIKVHRLAPMAVDTSFHKGRPLPSPSLSRGKVAAEVLAALASDVVVDKQLIAD
jgi:NAD(P)-dependent dehydrogenase (short-subunit alcohol dehydrogenase family)